MEAVKISEDDAVRAVFEQAVEELGPQEKPPATADDAEDRSLAVVHEQTDKETTSLGAENAKQEQAQPNLNPSEQTLVLTNGEDVRQGVGLSKEPGEKPVESTLRGNKSDEELVREVEDPVPNLAQDLVASTREPDESKQPSDQKDAKLNESQIWSFDSPPEGVREEQAGEDEGKQEGVESKLVKAEERTRDTDGLDERRKEDEWKIDLEEGTESKMTSEELGN